MAAALDSLDGGSLAQFQTRANAVFGDQLDVAVGLPPRAADSGWQLKKEQVFRSGRESEEASSDDEAQEPGQELITGEMLGMKGEEQELLASASTAFCRALDREDEYDSTDALASQSLRPEPPRDKPSLETEVLPDNVYERRTSHMAAGPHSSHGRTAASSAMDIDSGMLGGAAAGCAPTHGSRGPSGLETAMSAESGDDPRARGIPGTSVWDRLSRPGRDGRDGRDESQGRGDRPGTSHTGLGRPPRARGRSSTSYVPDHVRNPHKYTVYQFDEPVAVGVGDSAAAVSGHDNDQAARAALAAVRRGVMHQEAGSESAERAEPLPTFGSGIQFRPRGSAGAAAGVRTADSSSHGANDSITPDGQSRLGSGMSQTTAAAANSAVAAGASMAAADVLADTEEASIVASDNLMQADDPPLQMNGALSTGSPAAVKKRKYRTKASV